MRAILFKNIMWIAFFYTLDNNIKKISHIFSDINILESFEMIAMRDNIVLVIAYLLYLFQIHSLMLVNRFRALATVLHIVVSVANLVKAVNAEILRTLQYTMVFFLGDQNPSSSPDTNLILSPIRSIRLNNLQLFGMYILRKIL